MFEIIVGEGAHTVEEFWRIGSMTMARWIANGVMRRYRPTWEVARLQIQCSAASQGVKMQSEYAPWTEPFPWEPRPKDYNPTEEEAERDREAAEAEMKRMLEVMRGVHSVGT